MARLIFSVIQQHVNIYSLKEIAIALILFFSSVLHDVHAHST